MNAEELSSTLSELCRRLKKREDSHTDTGKYSFEPYKLNELIQIIKHLQISLQKSTESRLPINDFNATCTEENLVKDKFWYMQTFFLITDYYHYFQQRILPLNYVYPKITSLINCVINKINQRMNAEEISNTVIELRHRIDNNETEENNKKKYYLDVSQLNSLITLLTDLNTLYEQEKIPKKAYCISANRFIRLITNTKCINTITAIR